MPHNEDFSWDALVESHEDRWGDISDEAVRQHYKPPSLVTKATRTGRRVLHHLGLYKYSTPQDIMKRIPEFREEDWTSNA